MHESSENLREEEEVSTEEVLNLAEGKTIKSPYDHGQLFDRRLKMFLWTWKRRLTGLTGSKK